MGHLKNNSISTTFFLIIFFFKSLTNVNSKDVVNSEMNAKISDMFDVHENANSNLEFQTEFGTESTDIFNPDSEAGISSPVHCYRKYGSSHFKPIEFWVESLVYHSKYIIPTLIIQEFYDFPHGYGHQQHKYQISSICWRYPAFIAEFQLPFSVPQIDEEMWYSGCQIQLKRPVFQDLKIVCDTNQTKEECENSSGKHPFTTIKNVKQCK